MGRPRRPVPTAVLLALDGQSLGLHQVVTAEELAPAHALAGQDRGQRRERRLLLAVLDPRQVAAAEPGPLADLLQGQVALPAQPPQGLADEAEGFHIRKSIRTPPRTST